VKAGLVFSSNSVESTRSCSDKTGTLTYGRPEIRALLPLAGVTDELLLIWRPLQNFALSIRWAKQL